MNSSSPATVPMRIATQSRFACSMRASELETKFHQMWRGPDGRSADDD